jgi:hypothetical protein
MKTLLLFFLFAMTPLFAAEPAKKEKDITPLITSVVWKWDHPTAKGRTLKFKKDGTCESTHWKGVWKKVGERKVEIVQSGNINLKTTIEFTEDFTSFKGTHHDGGEIVGKRVGDVPSGVR